jgi:hypothetical protein
MKVQLPISILTCNDLDNFAMDNEKIFFIIPNVMPCDVREISDIEDPSIS